MLCVIPFCGKDHLAAANLLAWMAELDGQHFSHQVLLVAAFTVRPEERALVKEAAQATFALVTLVRTTLQDERPWPMAPNTMFKCAATFITQQFKVPFWWNEPDCIPLCSGWLDDLEAEYRRAGKPFMGSIVHKPCTHLTGCAIYPANIRFYNPAMLAADKIAFDCVQPEVTLRHTHHTSLFHHQWSDPEGPDVPTFKDAAKLGIINRNAVVFHRNKDHTLIDRLREQRALRQVAVLEVAGGSHEDVFVGGLAKPVVSEVLPAADDVIKSDADLAREFAGLEEAPRFEMDDRNPTDVKFVEERVPIYTYHMPIAGLAEASALLALWRELWTVQGWNPIVLTEADAASNPQFKPYRAVVSALPTVNHPAYERACYMRHLAMVERKGGFLVDYDVMPRRFTPADARAASEDRGMTFFEPTRVPCALKGGVAGFQGIVDFISSYKPRSEDIYNGKPHTSDMEILRQGRWKATAHCVEHLCSGAATRDQLGDGWRLAPMIHFSSYSFHKLGWSGKGQKHEWIRRVLAELPPLPAKEAKP